MEEKRWTDCELIRDGSGRWLWTVRSTTAVLGAGVAMSQNDAEHRGAEALDALDQKDLARQAVLGGPDWKTHSLDLDALERMDREEREGRTGQG